MPTGKNGSSGGASLEKPKSGRARSGLARAEALEPSRRSEIARQGAVARWGVKPVTATHRGNFRDEFGVDVECYVLGDAVKTAVISQRGMARVLGFGSGGRAFPRFLESKAMADSLGAELREKAQNPIKFQWVPPGAGPIDINGFDATLLIDICNAIIAAEGSGALKASRYENIVKQAHIIVGASAKSGIKHLVYALSGYNPTAQEVISAFKLYVQEEARKYEPEFPSELYLEWHRLYQIAVPVRGKPWQFKHLTVKHIYYPLAKSHGKILDLLRSQKAADGDRQKKLFQFLNEIGARALRVHLGRVLEMAESSRTADEYERKITARFGDQRELDLAVTAAPPTS